MEMICNIEWVWLTQVLIQSKNTARWWTVHPFVDSAYRKAFVPVARWAPGHTDDSSSLLHRQAKASRTGAQFNYSPKHQHDPHMLHMCVLKGGDPKHRQVREVGDGPATDLCDWRTALIQTVHSDSFLFHNTPPMKEEVKYANQFSDRRFGGCDCCSNPLRLNFHPPPPPKTGKNLFLSVERNS